MNIKYIVVFLVTTLIVMGCGDSKPKENSAKKVVKKEAPKKSLVETDYQLYEALNFLKSMTLVQAMQKSK